MAYIKAIFGPLGKAGSCYIRDRSLLLLQLFLLLGDALLLGVALLPLALLLLPLDLLLPLEVDLGRGY
jgi:hypothetical protein